jgi:peptidoglycan/LPS O-acetylase OafA/YrhL
LVKIKTKGHIPVLDGLRGLAIIPVLIYHFSNLYKPDLSSVDIYIYKIMKAGWIGVDLFFVLSGFLITGILYDTKESKNYFTTFYYRRLLRIFPLYYAALIFLFIVIPWVYPSMAIIYNKTIDNQKWFWLYVSNWYFASQGGIGDTPGGYFWSLAVEEQFYLIWPLLIYFVDKKNIIYCTVFVFILSAATRIILLINGFSAASLYCMTNTHMEGLALGAFLAVFIRQDIVDITEYHINIIKIFAALLLACMISFAVIRGGFVFWDELVSYMPMTLLAVLFGCLLLIVIYEKENTYIYNIFNNNIIKSFGKFSYALYIIHVPLGRFIKIIGGDILRKCSGGSIIAERFIFIIISTIASYLLAYMSWHLFEKQVLKLKSKLSY